MTDLFKDAQGRLVEVSERANGVVVFCAQGGGFIARMPEAEFDKQFTPGELDGYKPMSVTIDGLDAELPAFGRNERWNGWCMPYFKMEDALKLNDSLHLGLAFDPAKDAITWLEDGEIATVHGVDVEVDGKIHHVYPVGAGSWCWDEVEENDPNRPSQMRPA